MLKKIEAIVRIEKLKDVVQALEGVGIRSFTAYYVFGRGVEGGVRSGPWDASFLPKVKVEVVVYSGDVDKVVKAIAEAAYTGKPGDGKIFVLPVEDAMRIRTGERGYAAISV